MARAQPSKRSRRKLIVFASLIGAVLILPIAFYGTTTTLENNDAFCASCHTEPESTFFTRSQAAPVDLASAHAAKKVTCIECHSGEGVPGRIQAIGLGAGDLFAYLSGNYSKPAIVKVPVTDEHCLKCHADVTQKRDFNNHFHLFLARWQKLDPQAATCVDCHKGHDDKGSPQIRWLQEQPTIAICQACHTRIGG